MNKELVKGLIIGTLITGIIAYYYFKGEMKNIDVEYNAKMAELAALLDKNNEIIPQEEKDNIKLIELGHSSEIIADFKATLDGFFADENIIGNTDDLYDENFEEFLIPIIDGTSGVMKNNGSLNKAFLYDINKTISNISGKEITLHDFRNEYEDGIQYKGAKGYGVGDLQALINRLYQSEAIDENNTYDKETYAKVMELFAGTTALVDLEIGSISKEFINNFNIILDNIDN